MARTIGVVRRAAQGVQGVLTLPEKWAYQRGLRTTKGMTLPDFLGIGAQKGGTSWLYENLRCHPDLFLPDQKEMHFFDRRYHRPLRSYAAKFQEAGSRKKGEITPSYGDLPQERIEFIRTVMPDVRLVLLLRDPIQRAWSHAQMHLLEKGQERRRIEDVSEAEFLAHFRGEDSRSKGDYPGMIRRWTTVFPRDQLFIGFFEDVSQDPEGLLGQVLRHIGAGIPHDWSGFPLRQVVNKGQKNPLPDGYRQVLLDLYREPLQELRSILGDRVSQWGCHRARFT